MSGPNTGMPRKPTSPMRDGLRLLLRNKPALMAMFAIGLLAAAAVTGELLTGKAPTADEIKMIAENRHIGDRVDLEVNSWAVVDPLDTQLTDKLLPPFSRSKETGKFYVLGTDHLGRNVVARLWKGSSISLTIGFLAVGISVFLGITLGGIAGFWGRERIQLPFFGMLMLVLLGGIAWGADFVLLGSAMFVVALLLFLFLLVITALGRRWGVVIAFGVVLALAAGVFGYNTVIEHSEPNGDAMRQAARLHALSHDTLLTTRDYGTHVKGMEDKLRGYVYTDAAGQSIVTDEWERRRRIGQAEVEVRYKELEHERAVFDLVAHDTSLAVARRTRLEREVRARHLERRDRPDLAATTRGQLEQDDERIAELEQGRAELEQKVEASAKALQTQRELLEAVRANPDGDEAMALTLQDSTELLDRRAEMRNTYLNHFAAEVSNRRSDGIYNSKLLSGHWRYSVYRVTRHFITMTIVLFLLLVGVLMVAGASQAAALDVGGPLSKAFLPTMTVDDLVMRFTEIMMTIPTLFLILAVLALFERDVYIVMAVIGLTSWMGTTRFVRAEILSLREQDFIQAARALGMPDTRIMWRHLVPNAISPVLVSATIGVATAVLAESTLSFLGIGAKADQPTWGQILNDGRAYMTDAWWLMVIPGVAILLTVLAFNLLGEGLREAFNPKLRGR
jgi:ABC-type dipeptide/oligopeptide/nickel transport system permease subunit